MEQNFPLAKQPGDGRNAHIARVIPLLSDQNKSFREGEEGARGRRGSPFSKRASLSSLEQTSQPQNVTP